MGFAVIGVINGVFMQETFKVASTDDVIMVRQKSNAMKLHHQNMSQLFAALDNKGSGQVTRKEFRLLADYPDVKTWLASMDLQTDDMETMFNLMDENNGGSVTLEQLLKGMAKLKGHARSIDLWTLMRTQELAQQRQDSQMASMAVVTAQAASQAPPQRQVGKAAKE